MNDIQSLVPIDPTSFDANLVIDIEFAGSYGFDRYRHYRVSLIWDFASGQWTIDWTSPER